MRLLKLEAAAAAGPIAGVGANVGAGEEFAPFQLLVDNNELDFISYALRLLSCFQPNI